MGTGDLSKNTEFLCSQTARTEREKEVADKISRIKEIREQSLQEIFDEFVIDKFEFLGEATVRVSNSEGGEEKRKIRELVLWEISYPLDMGLDCIIDNKGVANDMEIALLKEVLKNILSVEYRYAIEEKDVKEVERIALENLSKRQNDFKDNLGLATLKELIATLELFNQNGILKRLRNRILSKNKK